MSFQTPSRSRKTTQSAIKRNTERLPLPTDVLADNLRATTNAALLDDNTDTVAAGTWYARYRTLFNHLAEEHSQYTVEQITCAFAALSPATDIDRNETLLLELLTTGDCNHMYSDATNKAKAVLKDPIDPYRYLKGSKVKSFANNLLRPNEPGHVTIDRHAYSILLGRPTSDSERKILQRRGVYFYLAGIYRAVAREYGLLPHELQALTWTYYRQELNADLPEPF